MLKPVMHKHIITIIIFLLCLLVSRPAEARLTLGVVTGPDDSIGEMTPAQANSLASLIAEKLHEEIVVKELSDYATLINWLDRFAMLDLALLPTKEVKANPGRFLQIGSFDKQNRYNLVVRQGADSDLPKRLATLIRETGDSFLQAVETTAALSKQPPSESSPPAELGSVSIDEEIASQAELQHVPPLTPGRAWLPQEENTYREILPTDERLTKMLVIGVFPDPGGLVRTSQQAGQLAAYLEQLLPVSVKVREFTSVAAFAEWFMRYRMVDLAVVSPGAAETNLGRDYLAVAKFLRADKPGLESAALVVVRRGQNEELQLSLQHALLDMVETENGQSVMAALKISEVLAPESDTAQLSLIEQKTEAVLEVEQPSLELGADMTAKLLPLPAEYAEPLEPVAPPVVAVKELPELVSIVEPVDMFPVAEVPAVVLTLPEPATVPVAPVSPPRVEAVKVPDAMARQLQPQQPDVPPLPAAVAPIAPPELTAIVEPAQQAPAAKPLEIALLPIPELPEIVATPPIKQEDVILAPDEIPNVEVPAAPDVTQPAEISKIQLPGEPVASVAPPVLTEAAITGSAAPLETEQPEAPLVITESVPAELEPPGVASVQEGLEPEPALKETLGEEAQQVIAEDVLRFVDAVPSDGQAGEPPVSIDEQAEAWSDEEFAAVLGEDLVAAVVSQPDIPQELRPSGIPVVRPGRIAQRTTAVEEHLLLASIPEPLKNIVPPRPPNLLPEPEPEPGVIYVVPFVAVMVPDEVNARVFDQFVDTLNREGEPLGLQFVILKEGLQRVSPEWLSIRKYVTGEIYAYVEDSGCCSTDLRTKARLTYHRPGQEAPAFGFEYPVKNFFDHDRSSIDIERIRVADDIAATLSTELLEALQN